jgi:hypothetical protein
MLFLSHCFTNLFCRPLYSAAKKKLDDTNKRNSFNESAPFLRNTRTIHWWSWRVSSFPFSIRVPLSRSCFASCDIIQARRVQKVAEVKRRELILRFHRPALSASCSLPSPFSLFPSLTQFRRCAATARYKLGESSF